MGNAQKDTGPVVQQVTPSEIRSFIMIAQNRLSLSRNKRIDTIRKKKSEIIKSLQENNLDVAKAKMDSLIREEDLITSYDILTPLLEILKERVTYIISSIECPSDLRAQLDSVIYASTRMEFEELLKLRDLIGKKYGTDYIQKADNNADKLVNINLVEKLKIKPASDGFLLIRLKQLCKEKNINYVFPSEIISDIPDYNNINQNSGDFNPYASTQGVNPYALNNNNNNPYSVPNNGNNDNPFNLGNNPNTNNGNINQNNNQNNNNPYAVGNNSGNNPFEEKK